MDDRVKSYVKGAVARALQAVRDAPDGARNVALNDNALAIGKFVPRYISYDAARNALGIADTRPGDDGDVPWGTIESGLAKGMSEPRDIEAELAVKDAASTTVDLPTEPIGSIAEPGTTSWAPPVRLDWQQLLESTEPTEEWIVEPVIAARRLVAIYSPPKVGKSLLMLEIAVGIARGTRVLGSTPDKPRRVLYVDFENDPHGDIKDRLHNMHIRAGDHEQLENLCYLSFPSMAMLDTPQGARELAATAAYYDCKVVVIDTISRAVEGEENSNDTWLNFYKHTGKLLKSQGIGLIRLDHTGKDDSKGMRGGSAKVGDVDAIWKLSKIGNSDTELKLELDDARMRIPEQDRVLTLHRRDDPLRHDVDPSGAIAIKDIKVQQIVDALVKNEADQDLKQREARELLRDSGVPLGQTHLTEALRRYKLLILDTKQGGINDQLRVIPDAQYQSVSTEDRAA